MSWSEEQLDPEAPDVEELQKEVESLKRRVDVIEAAVASIRGEEDVC